MTAQTLSKDIGPKLVVVDIGATLQFNNITCNYTGCITKRVGTGLGFYGPKLQRRLALRELGMLQGVDMKKAATDHGNKIKWKGIPSKSEMGGVIGNAMSRSILDRLLPRVLFSAGPLASMPPDRWAAGLSPL